MKINRQNVCTIFACKITSYSSFMYVLNGNAKTSALTNKHNESHVPKWYANIFKNKNIFDKCSKFSGYLSIFIAVIVYFVFINSNQFQK